MKRALFVTYYWPPSGKASLHWPIRMVQHLPAFGWQPYVLTVADDTFSEKDTSFAHVVDPAVRVARVRSIEPFRLYRSFLGKKKDEPLVASETISRANASLRHRFAIWVRMNLFVPDARIGWYWNAVHQGVEAFRNEKIDCVVSVGPPHTSLLVGRKLAMRLGVPHVPVFIDPWADIAYYRGFKRSVITTSLDRRLERSVLEHAGRIVFVTKSMKEDYEERYPGIRNKSHVLYWGYDEEAFQDFRTAAEEGQKTIVHAGNIFDLQNPTAFWESVRNELDSGKKFRLVFVGTVGPEVRKSIDETGLGGIVAYKGFLPYEKMVHELGNASYLLVCASEKRHVPGKLFEYLRAGKPIIAFGNDNREVEEILNKCRAGILLPYQNSNTEIFKVLESVRPDPGAAKQFERRVIASELAQILASLPS